MVIVTLVRHDVDSKPGPSNNARLAAHRHNLKTTLNCTRGARIVLRNMHIKFGVAIATG